MISGFATPEGTAEFSENSGANSGNYRRIHDLMLSNVGMGTYLGEPDAETDALVESAVKSSVSAGINVFDTAINYRAQRAERSLGRALECMIKEGALERAQVFVSTKNGYVTHDSEREEDFWSYVKKEYTEPGIIKSGEMTSRYHCMSDSYLNDQLDRSLRNLNLECVDLVYIHNPVEGQDADANRDDLLRDLLRVFELYEEKRREGRIRFYGVATWENLRADPSSPQYLSLDEMLDIAQKAGGDSHGLRFVQLPFNLYYDQAYMSRNHRLDGGRVSVLVAAAARGIGVFTSVPFMQGKLLAPGVMPEFGHHSPPLRALQFIRSTPGVCAPLPGFKSPEHVRENLQIMDIPPLSAKKHAALVKELVK